MTYTFRPEPEPAERAALEFALDQLLGAEPEEPSPYQREWGRTALEEGVSSAQEDEFVL
jgi:hypothetical protein